MDVLNDVRISIPTLTKNGAFTIAPASIRSSPFGMTRHVALARGWITHGERTWRQPQGTNPRPPPSTQMPGLPTRACARHSPRA